MSHRPVVSRVLAVLGMLVVAILFGAAPASAAVPMLPIPGLPSCQNPPVPQSPDRGFSGFITPRPTDPPPLEADPFAEGATTGVYETTGLAGYRWSMYVDSCVPGPGQATNSALTSTANSIMAWPVLAVGFVATLADVVYNQTWLDQLDAPVGYVSNALYEGFTQPFFPVLAVAVGVVMIVSIRRARLSAAISTGTLVLVAATLAAFAANYPTRVADLTDSVTSGAITSVNRAIVGTEGADPSAATVRPLVDAILYDRWVAGTLGDTTSSTAREYGPVLFTASTLTWAETDVVRTDPNGAGAELIEAKQDQWREAAEAIKASDPDAYEYLTGARSLDRIGHAIVAFALMGILPILVMSLVLVAMSYLIIRLVVMFLPLVALIALLLRGTLRGVLSLCAAALINSIVFAVGAAVTAYLYGVFLSPDTGLPALLGILLAFLVGIAMWIILSPYRRLTTMVRGTDAVKTTRAEYARTKRGATSFVSRAGTVALGVFAGNRATAAAEQATTPGNTPTVPFEPYRYGPGEIRPEHVAAPAYDERAVDRSGPPAELPGPAPAPALTGPRSAMPRPLPGPRRAVVPESASRSARGPAEPDDVDPRTSDRRPEMAPLLDFDPVVVDGRSVAVIHTLDGPVVDLADTDRAVVAGEVTSATSQAR
ncbi:hypothetical protein [Aquipuribacter hungaricus]|uniref:TrbL/VirB6 plasmid conjugal transfer protein n=1 Tax=Aquipuribacter hungaricus TaxID=545624 RepID=A0ABV7WC89_9MICO